MVFQSLFFQAKEQKKQQKPVPKEEVPKPSKKRKDTKDTKQQSDKPSKKQKHTKESSKQQAPRKKRQPPSADALALSQTLKEFSKQKKLTEALELYRKKRDEGVIDQHHACIMLDCCARCGSFDTVDEILKSFHEKALSVETHTARLKCYAHAGRMHEAHVAFKNMIHSKKVNVRSLNTLLRGCQWSAATRDDKGNFAGGIVTSEEAWRLFVSTVGDKELDVSSYEYTVSLLCQALRLDEAKARIDSYLGAMDIKRKGKATFVGGNQSSLETLAVMYLALARAFCLIGKADDVWQSAQLGINACKLSLKQLEEEGNTKDDKDARGTKGGKRAWKHKDSDENAQARRLESNRIYRKHRLSEMEAELSHLIKVRSSVEEAETVEKRLRDRLVYLSGGASSSQQKRNKMDVRAQPLISFGVKDKGGRQKSPKLLDANAELQLDARFENPKKDLDIEIGAGFGDWIVNKAKANPGTNHLAVELRADRVYQIFSKAFLADVAMPNIAVVGSESETFLEHSVKEGSVSTIFVNHPEPPTQIYGSSNEDRDRIIKGGDEPSHMLRSSTIIAALRCLKKGGRIVIVTDNYSYSNLLSATIVKCLTTCKDLAFRCATPKDLRQSKLRVSGPAQDDVYIFEGVPDAAIGHAETKDGASYFDRLWKSGISSHAETTKRFILVLIRE